ncbi:unnamed protein product [Kuraishia capsulata CBS 1993]|uniref:Uncharacterized protein n=1 Tax=Kuraishia capsulata CBS 1993 TaxID=1382522 RepID=W6MS59_9ASCO|nr:uncharacterized protein KUCA_T00005619001 [Kuraishia capsulata CBS 1993]CDK29626.1 unnamed protein product [Kuraishia capsulata CBS 1993]
MTQAIKPQERTIQSPRDWIKLAILICVIAILSLGAHDMAISHMGVPYPFENHVPLLAQIVGQIIRIGSMTYACHLASWYLDQFSMPIAVAIFGLLIVMLQGTLRDFVVTCVVTDGMLNGSWLFTLITLLPRMLNNFFNGAIAVTISRSTLSQPWVVAAAVVGVATFGRLVFLPILLKAADWIVDVLNLTEPPEVYLPPYDFHVYMYIYGTFIEPTISSFGLVYLIWPGLKGSSNRHVLAFTVLILLIRGRVVALGLFSFWIQEPWVMAFAAEGQFFAEDLIMAGFTGLTWKYLSKPVEREGVLRI